MKLVTAFVMLAVASPAIAAPLDGLQLYGSKTMASTVPTSDGGLLAIGTTSDTPPGAPYEVGHSHPTVRKVDAGGRILWERRYDAKGFRDFEGASITPMPDGNFVLFVIAYPHPSMMGVTRLVKIDPQGKVLWTTQLRGKGSVHTPFAQNIVAKRDGSLAIDGHIYLDKSETVYRWTGKVDASGKVVVDRVGGRWVQPAATPRAVSF